MESTANKERTENGLTDYNLSCRALLNINDKAGEDTEFENMIIDIRKTENP